MKRRLIIALSVALLATGVMMAKRAKRAARVTIIDFVNEFVANPEDEFTGSVAQAWSKYLSHQPQDEGVQVEVDVKNGFMTYSYCDPEEPGNGLTMEMCYWNCADGKHKLVATSLWSTTEGRVTYGQFDGLTFRLYDTATGTSTTVPPEDLGVNLYEGIEHVINGYDAENELFFVQGPDGTSICMNHDEWEEWYAKRPVNTVTLPRQGKDILIVTHSGTTRLRERRLKWNGNGFTPAP